MILCFSTHTIFFFFLLLKSGIHTQDLVSLAEANKDFKADGSIHWEKFKLMGETIMATMKFKSPSYTIEPDTKLLALIADTYILTEDVSAYFIFFNIFLLTFYDLGTVQDVNDCRTKIGFF